MVFSDPDCRFFVVVVAVVVCLFCFVFYYVS